jgi:hypothetical protein
MFGRTTHSEEFVANQPTEGEQGCLNDQDHETFLDA